MDTEITITYSQEPYVCKRPECSLCKKGRGHSPQWYASTIINGSERHLYLGGEFRPVFRKEFLQQEQKSKKYKEQNKKDIQEFEKIEISNKIESAELAKSNNDCQQEVSLVQERLSKKPIKESKGCPINKKNPGLDIPLPPLPTSKEFYRDLNKFKNVRFKDVKVKYRQLIKKYHPDQFAGQDIQLQEWMKIINMVHETHLSRMQRFIR